MNNNRNQEPTKKTPLKEISGTAVNYNHIQHVFAIMSGKGGVGKSSVTGLLAAGLNQKEYKVGILDADITGPSIPMLFGLDGQVEQGTHGLLPLLSTNGIKIMSMNLLLPSTDQPIIWRGPMISKAITQLWGDVMWGDLDYLLIDLPPGTSDAALTIMQSLPLDGLLMVTTPQSLSALIVRKAVHMAQHINVPILGIIENMSYFICPSTNERYDIFGESHAEEVAKAAEAPVLATLPIDPNIANLSNRGKIEDLQLEEINRTIEVIVSAQVVQINKNDEDKKGH